MREAHAIGRRLERDEDGRLAMAPVAHRTRARSCRPLAGHRLALAIARLRCAIKSQARAAAGKRRPVSHGWTVGRADGRGPLGRSEGRNI